MWSFLYSEGNALVNESYWTTRVSDLANTVNMFGIKSLQHSLLIVLTIFVHINGRQSETFFRKDYTYSNETEAFYKIHTIHRTWRDAKERCALEGASLFYPEDKAEADSVISFWKHTQPFSWVYIGVSDSLVKEVFSTIDGRPISGVYNTWGPGEPNDQGGEEGCVILRLDGTLNDDRCDKKYPFICKKALEDVQWNQNCDMPNLGYILHTDLGRCYKFHVKPKTWSQAVATCDAEQSYLAVPNSQAEADFLVKLTADSNKDKVSGNYLAGVVHLGFYFSEDDDGWMTITGSPLDDSGYTSWAYQQPDGKGEEKCGTMFYNGQLNDVTCDRRCFFICEHDVASLAESFNDRVGTPN